MPRSPKKTALLSPSPADETAPLELDLLQALMAEAEINSDLTAVEESDETDEEALPALLPLVPIRDNVYFPHMIFPLLVGRERSVKAMEAASESEARYVILAAQKNVLIEDPEPGDIYEVGIIAEVMQLFKMPDNTVRVMLEGIRRVRLSDFVQTDPFMQVRIIPLFAEDAEGEATNEASPPLETEALVRTISAQFERIVAEGKNIPPEVLANLAQISEPGQIADTIIPYLSLRVEEKQGLLETLSVGERLQKLGAVLHKEFEILEVQKNIRARVEREMEGNQREFILREQLKAIQQELGERVSPFGDDKDGEETEWREKISAAQMPEAVQERALKELDRWEKTPLASPESGIIRNYLDWLVSMPWSVSTDETLEMSEAEAILDEDHWGLEKVKERMLEFLAVRKLAGSALKGPILCLVGPPGVGKTSLGKSVARALGRKFIRVSLGGVRDEAEIRGHRRTYVGAMPGRIIQAIKQSGVRNPVFLLDEMDKMGSDFRGDPSSALLEALDPEQNSEFSDHYLEAPFDLSDVLFLATANLLDPISPALRDRMEVISFSGYIEAEKLAIASRYLVPKQVENHGLTADLLAFEPDALRLLIREYTREAGVRNLEREIGAICRKVARRVASGDTAPITVTQADIKGFLGGRRFSWGVAEENDEVGTATGLVYTETGGDTVSIEVALTRSPLAINADGENKNGPLPDGRLLLTGQLGDVMKESAQTAWTFVKSRRGKLGLPEDAGVGWDIHVHVPAGAVPKDGPSAGVTLATALASAVSGRPVRKDFAMTGEITLRGKVLPVGGVKEKVIAAHRAGVRQIILPDENEKDLEDIPVDVKNDLCFTFVKTGDEVLKLALMPPAKTTAKPKP